VPDETPRSQASRTAAESALVRVVHHYGSRPEFALLGGLMPEYLCAGSTFYHAGTTDVDVQVDLEIACGTVNVQRLENGLRNAEFHPDSDTGWRWSTDEGSAVVVRFELLADSDSHPAGDTLVFEDCNKLGAVNLRGTGFAARDVAVRQLTAPVGDMPRTVEMYTTGLAGFLMAKTAAAGSRRAPKDWYDIAFVLLHNDAGGPEEAAHVVRAQFGGELVGATRTALDDLVANFSDPASQGAKAYASQTIVDHPQLDRAMITADGVVAVKTFYRLLFER